MMSERPVFVATEYGYDPNRCPHDYAPCPFCMATDDDEEGDR